MGHSHQEKEARRAQRERTVARARDLRRELTFPERLLWSRLRSRRLFDLKFRRQHPVGPFIADFYCDEARLVVEVDGESHVGRAEADARRAAFMEARGMRLLRVTNDDVLQDLDAVLTAIARAAGINI